MNVLVTILSDQTVPAIEFIKEKQAETDKFLFISSQYIENKGIRQWIETSLQLNPNRILNPPIVVNAYDFDDITDQLNNSINDDDHYVVNLTGGTKIQLLAVHDFFRNLDSEMYYLEGNGTYLKVHPGRRKLKMPLKTQITLEEYLLGHGFTIKHTSTPTFSKEDNQNILKKFLVKDFEDQYTHVLQELRKRRGRSLGDIDKIPQAKSLVQDLGIQTKNKNALSKDEIKSLTGEWFEDYLFHFMRDVLEIPADSIGLGYKVEKNGTENEFDVMLVHRNKLFLFECKTSIYIDKEDRKHIVQSTIYKSDALRRNFGLFAKTFIVTLSDLSGPNFQQHLQRANASGIGVIDKSFFLSDLKDKLQVLIR